MTCPGYEMNARSCGDWCRFCGRRKEDHSLEELEQRPRRERDDSAR